MHRAAAVALCAALLAALALVLLGAWALRDGPV